MKIWSLLYSCCSSMACSKQLFTVKWCVVLFGFVFFFSFFFLIVGVPSGIWQIRRKASSAINLQLQPCSASLLKTSLFLGYGCLSTILNITAELMWLRHPGFNSLRIWQLAHAKGHHLRSCLTNYVLPNN